MRAAGLCPGSSKNCFKKDWGEIGRPLHWDHHLGLGQIAWWRHLPCCPLPPLLGQQVLQPDPETPRLLRLQVSGPLHQLPQQLPGQLLQQWPFAGPSGLLGLCPHHCLRPPVGNDKRAVAVLITRGSNRDGQDDKHPRMLVINKQQMRCANVHGNIGGGILGARMLLFDRK